MQYASSTEITIPETVEYDGVTYNVTSIAKQAFYGCQDLASVTIGNAVTTIGEEAFISRTKLTSVTIGNSVTTIGKRAFSSCNNLTSVTSLNTTAPVISTGGTSIFATNTYNNGTLYVPTGSTSAYKTWGWSGFKNVVEKDFTTAIPSAKAETEKATAIYDITGRKLSAPKKGINIIGGKKRAGEVAPT